MTKMAPDTIGDEVAVTISFEGVRKTLRLSLTAPPHGPSDASTP